MDQVQRGRQARCAFRASYRVLRSSEGAGVLRLAWQREATRRDRYPHRRAGDWCYRLESGSEHWQDEVVMTSDSHRMTKQQRLARFTLRGQGRFRDDEEGQMGKPATMVRRQDDWIYIE